MENNIVKFRTDMLEEIRNETMINYSDPTSEFLTYYTDKLITAEEILEFESYDIEVIGTNRRKCKVDGYSFDGLDRSISLFIADFSNSDEISTLTNSIIDQCHARVINYLDCVYNRYLEKNGYEESSEAYQLATDILVKDKFIHKIKIYILSDSVLSSYVKDITADDYLDKKVELIIWDVNRIFNLVNSALKKEDLNINFSDFSNTNIPCIKAISSERYDSYLAVVSGELLADLYIKYGPRLLEGNVRSFLSVRGKINKGIRNTIRDEPDIFFVYNNGIACTATDAQIESSEKGLLIKGLTNFQIINGGQTTASIANAVLQDKARKNVSRISVPMKLTVINKDAIDDEDLDSIEIVDNEEMMDLSNDQKRDAFTDNLTSNIARFANSQNKVDESDFFSNHPFHVRFESLARRIYAPPTNGIPHETIWFYERAKGQYTQEQMKLTVAEKKRFASKYPKKQMIKKIDLAKYIMTYKQKPYIVSKGNQFNMRIFANVIETEWKSNKDHTNFNNYYFKKCISLAILFKKTELLVSKSEWYQSIKAYRANIVTYAISSLFYMIDHHHKDMELNYIRIWNEQDVYDELEEELKDLTYKVYKKITGKRETENVTEWCKKEACWQQTEMIMNKREWELSPLFVLTLVKKDDNDDSMRNEKKEQKENDGIQAQTKVIKIGEEYWSRVLNFGVKMKILSETEISILKTATNFNKYIPSDKQSLKILELQEKMIYEGFKLK